MVDNATVFQNVQLGVESAWGSAVAANKQPLAMQLSPEIQMEFNSFGPQGQKFDTIHAANKEWADIPLDGAPTYTEIIYILAGLMNNSPSTTTGVTTWTFTSTPGGPDTVKSYTLEFGSSVAARRVAGAIFRDFTLVFDRNAGVSMSGALVAKAVEEGITLTATPTALALIPILAKEINLYVNDSFGAIGTTQWEKAFHVEFALTGKFNLAFFLDRAGGLGPGSYVEVKPTVSVTISAEADTEGMSLLTAARASTTKFFRFEAISGTNISGGTPTTAHSLVLDFCAVPKAKPFSDEDGIYKIEYECMPLYDATAAKAFSVVVKNGISAL